MLTIQDLLRDLNKADKNARVSIFLPSGTSIACHFHVTEIGKTVKKFVDCGGVKRELSNTTFQVWVANDYEHKLTVERFLQIIEAGKDLVDDEDGIVFEYDNNTINLYSVNSVQVLEHFFYIYLGNVKANCLAPDKCGIKQENSCCGSKGCC